MNNFVTAGKVEKFELSEKYGRISILVKPDKKAYVQVKVFGNVLESVKKYAKEGAGIMLIGHLVNNNYEKTNENGTTSKVNSTEEIADRVQYPGNRILYLNKVEMIGNVSSEPKMSQGQNSKVANYGLAVNESYKEKNSTEWKERTTFVNISSFNADADQAETFKNGNTVHVTGEFRQESYEKDGKKYYVQKVVAGAEPQTIAAPTAAATATTSAPVKATPVETSAPQAPSTPTPAPAPVKNEPMQTSMFANSGWFDAAASANPWANA